MNFSEWRRLQRNVEMFKISEVFVAEGIDKQQFENIVHTFLPFAKKELKIKELPKIYFVNNSKFSKRIAALGDIKDNRIVIDIQNRQTIDILRTLAHKLTHYRQHTKGVNGSGHAEAPTENEAKRLAGTIVRKFGEKHSGLFTTSSVMEAKKKKRKKMIDIDSDHYPMELT